MTGTEKTLESQNSKYDDNLSKITANRFLKTEKSIAGKA